MRDSEARFRLKQVEDELDSLRTKYYDINARITRILEHFELYEHTYPAHTKLRSKNGPEAPTS